MIGQFEERRAAADAGILLHGSRDEAELARMERAAVESDEYAECLREFLDVSDALEALQGDEWLKSELNEVGLGSDSPAQPKRAAAQRAWGRYVAMAAAVIVAVAVWQWPASVSTGADMSRYVTRVGEQRQVDLPDGSQVMLNTGTELVVAMSDNKRSVIMKRGEGYFSIAPDPSRPFSVTVGDRSVTVLGTAFNLRKSQDGFTLAVAEGMVAVHAEYEPVNAAAGEVDLPVGESLSATDALQKRFGAGMVAEFDKDRQQLVAYRSKSMRSHLAWQSGVLRFEGVPLSEVVMELNRYSGKKILVHDADLLDISIFASIRVDDISSALSVLDVAFPVDVVHEFDQILLIPPKGSQ